MVYNSAHYVSADHATIRVCSGDQTIFVPCDASNRHYAEIMAQVAAGSLEVQPYVEAPAPPPAAPAPSLADLIAQIQALQSEIEVLKAR